ncbi:hypothetical protein IEQ34_013870 [Dendrobium chrysotoxum]|uniref:Uncharacterized protein n=1 Tax=Dendrobium chrysotoxum TaxID=161865 RepID=A0AAV7GTH9_DENCH|nr:hypothetical protein IEQ34_013870 [Dendrobium chrysotoxum]
MGEVRRLRRRRHIIHERVSRALVAPKFSQTKGHQTAAIKGYRKQQKKPQQSSQKRPRKQSRIPRNQPGGKEPKRQTSNQGSRHKKPNRIKVNNDDGWQLAVDVSSDGYRWWLMALIAAVNGGSDSL